MTSGLGVIAVTAKHRVTRHQGILTLFYIQDKRKKSSQFRTTKGKKKLTTQELRLTTAK